MTEELARVFLNEQPWETASFVRPDMLHALPAATTPRPRNSAEERLEIMRGFDTGVFRKGSLAKNEIDERDPTADRRLIEFTLRLPPEQLLHEGAYKPLARRALADRLPPAVLNAPVRGYQGADWISRIKQSEAFAGFEEIASNSTVQEVIDLARLRARIEDWPDLQGANANEIFAFGRHVTNALAMGIFLVESQDQAAMGR